MGRQSREAEERKYFMRRIEEMEEDLKYGTFTQEMPRPKIVKYHDLLGKLWGWDKLLPMGDSVSWSDYSTYLKEYYCRNVDALGSIGALFQTCLNSEEQLVSEWRIQMKSENLPIRKSMVLSCLIHQLVDSFIRKGCSFSDMPGAAFLCIAKEAGLTCQLLRRGAHPVDDYLIDQGREIRTCALSLMNCATENSAAACAVMLGMAKEAEMMCAWMSENNKPVDFDDDIIPDEICDSRIVRYRTLDVMVNILEESSAASGHKIDKGGPASSNDPGVDGDGITADGAANTTGGRISHVLNTQYKKKIEGGEKKYLLEKLWGWERLLPLSGSVKWADYRSYLEEYYRRNASEFVAGAPLTSCLNMEEELLSEWKTRVKRCVHETLPVSTIIQSGLIKELALSICSTRGELSAPSDVAFVCITKEADLMCELLKHGAEPIDYIIEQSSVIRMCALGLANLKGNLSPAGAMVGMAKEAKKMCDWVKREKKRVTFSCLSGTHDLEECRLIRIKALDVMTRILLDSSFPCPKMQDDDAMACD